MDAVTAEIHERAATELLDVAQLAGGVRQAYVENRLDVTNPTDGAAANGLQRLAEQGMKPVVEAFDEMPAGGARRGHHLRGVLRIIGEGLLHQHMFAVGQRGRTPFQVRRRRQCHVHQVDIIVRDQFGITTQGDRNRVLGGEVARALQIA